MAFSFFLFSLKFSLALVWGVIQVGIVFYESKIIQAQRGTARYILISEHERNIKDGLSLFQAQVVKIDKV